VVPVLVPDVVAASRADFPIGASTSFTTTIGRHQPSRGCPCGRSPTGYFTAHPPSCTICTSAGADVHVQRRSSAESDLDPLLFAELPWFSNWELSQMTKWGMPGRVHHASWTGGRRVLGSVAYNHNGHDADV